MSDHTSNASSARIIAIIFDELARDAERYSAAGRPYAHLSNDELSELRVHSAALVAAALDARQSPAKFLRAVNDAQAEATLRGWELPADVQLRARLLIEGAMARHWDAIDVDALEEELRGRIWQAQPRAN